MGSFKAAAAAKQDDIPGTLIFKPVALGLSFVFDSWQSIIIKCAGVPSGNCHVVLSTDTVCCESAFVVGRYGRF